MLLTIVSKITRFPLTLCFTLTLLAYWINPSLVRAEEELVSTDDVYVDFEEAVIDHSFSDTAGKISYHRKIKFNTKKGIEKYPAHRVTLNPRISNLQGIEGKVTHADGSVTAITSKDVLEKFLVKEWKWKKKEYKIVFPNVLPGSTVEYSFYVITTHRYAIEQWPFQDEIPVKRSSITFYPATGLRWGYSVVNIHASPEIKKGKRGSGSFITITSKDIPPFRSEAFSQPKESLLEAAVFYYSDSDLGHKHFWKEYGRNYYRYSLRKNLKPCKAAKKIVEANEKLFKEDPVRAAYRYVQSHYIPLEYLTKDEEDKVDQKYRDKIGDKFAVNGLYKFPYLNSLQICMVTANLIKTARRKAKIDFVFYTPWDEGLFNPNVTTILQFYHCMLRVTLDGESYWLCPGLRFLPFNHLPYGLYGTSVFVCGESAVKIEQIPFDTYTSNTMEITTDVTLKEGNIWHVNRKLTLDKHSSYVYRRKFLYYPKYEWLYEREKVLKDTIDKKLKLLSFTIHNAKEIDKLLVIKEEFDFPTSFDRAGDSVFFRFPLLKKMKHNPFIREKRNNPIIFDYPGTFQRTFTYRLSKNFTIEGLPKGGGVNKQFYMYRNTFSKQDAHTIVVKDRTTIEHNMLSSKAYGFLKRTFDSIINLQKGAAILTEEQL